MDYIKLGTRYYRDPAILAANKRTTGQAELLFLRALAQCGADETEGQIPEEALQFLGIRNAEKVAAVLVDVGLWLVTADGWAVRSWAKWQSEHDALARRRAADKARKQAERARTAASDPPPRPPTGHVTSADTSRDSPPPNARDYRDREKEEGTTSLLVPDREDVDRLCQHLADRVAADGSRRPTISKAWRDAARLMLDRDGRTEAQIHTAIDWCQDDDFWRSNILSMPKLRERYDQLKKAAHRSTSRPDRPGNPYLDDLRAASAPALSVASEPTAQEGP